MKTFPLFMVVLILLTAPVYADDTDEKWALQYDLLIQDACSTIKGDCIVRYSAYETDGLGLPKNNLNDLAITGKVIVREEHNDFWGKGKDYQSAILENPTWRTLNEIANEKIKTTGDHHHRYLEKYQVIKVEDGIKFVQLIMGS